MFIKMSCSSLLPPKSGYRRSFKNLVAMKEILYGTSEKEPQTEAVAQLLKNCTTVGSSAPW